MLEDYPLIVKRGEVSYGEIIRVLKERDLRLNVPDLAQLVLKYIQEKGIRVWR
jgi:hypothetical protein